MNRYMKSKARGWLGSARRTALVSIALMWVASIFIPATISMPLLDEETAQSQGLLTSAVQDEVYANAPESVRETLAPPSDPKQLPLGPELNGYIEAWKKGGSFEDMQAAFEAYVIDLQAQMKDLKVGLVEEADDDDQGTNAPSFTVNDVRPGCDVDRDGFTDMFVTARGDAYTGNGAQTFTRAVSGQNGRRLWTHGNGFIHPLFGNYLPVPLVNIFPLQLPTGEYLKPQIWDTTETDLNGGGICDVLVHGLTGIELILTTYVNFFWIKFYYYIAALDGANGREIWRTNYEADLIIYLPRPLVCPDSVVHLDDVLTNFDHFNTPLGPRYVMVTHTWDIVDVRYQCPVNNNARIADFNTITNITLRDSTNDAQLQRRLLEYNNPNGIVINRLRGEHDLMGDGPQAADKEILLDRFDPLTGNCVLKTLRGRDLGDFWELPYTNFQNQQGQFPNGEETQEALIWCLSYFIPDVVGDGYPEVLASVFTLAIGQSSTFNGGLRTHWRIFYGDSGREHWSKDIRNQGWGYMQVLDARSEARSDPVAFLETALTDFPQSAAIGDRFPKKETHANLLNLKDGIPIWFNTQEWAQSNRMVYDYSLYQYMGDGTTFPYRDFNGGTPKDANGDGSKELLTAADYVQPRGPIQVLLSTQTHKYHAFNGVDRGDGVSDMEAWSGMGIAMPCGGVPSDRHLTVISGHSRRVDLSRYDLRTGELIWRQPLYNDSTIQAMTSSKETVFLIPQCAVLEDGRTMFSFNLGVFSLRRRLENIPLQGFMTENATLQWVTPELNGKPPLESSLKIDFLLYAPPQKPSTGERMFIAMTPALPGMAVGFGLAGAVGRAVRKRRGK